MKDDLVLSYTVELKPGDRLTLPAALVEKVGPGRWTVTVSPSGAEPSPMPVRLHDAFLSGYAPEDEGLYDDLPG